MSERENYREVSVAGTDLMLKCWTEGTRLMTSISWPPHGIERPLNVTLTLSHDEVDLMASAFVSRDWAPAESLLVHIGAAVFVQCGVLRKMQEIYPDMTILPPSEVSL
jgi:hypothetical protein